MQPTLPLVKSRKDRMTIKAHDGETPRYDPQAENDSVHECYHSDFSVVNKNLSGS
jgi:hypothetical protein